MSNGNVYANPPSLWAISTDMYPWKSYDATISESSDNLFECFTNMLHASSGENLGLPSGGESSRDLLPRLSSLIMLASTDPSINLLLTVSHRAMKSSLRTVCVLEDPNFHNSLQHRDMPFANSPSSGTSLGFIDATMIPFDDMVTPKMEQILEQASAHCS